MLILTFEIMAGYLLGYLVKKRWLVYLISLPVAVLVHVAFKILMSTLHTQSADFLEPGMMIFIGILYTSVTALGVYLARRHLRRGSF
jgi:hypothetical protein